MDQMKIDNYLRENPGQDFPSYVVLDKESCENIRSSLFKQLGLNPLVGNLKLVNEVDRRGDISDGIGYDEENFDLKQALLSLGLGSYPEFVYINWYRYDDIDKIKLVDIVNNFEDILYPGVDDIDIFDDSLMWILSVSHGGRVKVLKM